MVSVALVRQRCQTQFDLISCDKKVNVLCESDERYVGISLH